MRRKHAAYATDLFNNYDVKKLKGKGNIKKIYKSGCKKLLAVKIFLKFIELLLDDLVEGNIFHFPGSSVATLGFKSIKNDHFKRAIRSGKFPNLDYLVSNFTAYILIFRYFYGKSFLTRDVVISERHRKRMIEKTNEGFKYC